MTVFCFLWNADISQGSMKTKRKRLSGASAKKAVGVLDELSAASYGRKISLIFDKHQDYIYPVGSDMKTSFPDMNDSIASSCLLILHSFFSDTSSTAVSIIYIHVYYNTYSGSSNLSTVRTAFRTNIILSVGQTLPSYSTLGLAPRD